MSLPPWIHSLEVSVALVQGGVVGLWLALVGGVAVLVQRRQRQPSEVTRKIVHIGTGNVILLAWWLQTPAWMGIGAAVVFSGVALLSYRFPILPGINGVGRTSWGTFFYAVSIGVLTAVFWPWQGYGFAALGILVMTWGDGLAALVGQAYGRHGYRVWGSAKSWEGSGTMAIATWVIAAAILARVYGGSWGAIAVGLVVAIVATTLEAFSRWGIDNLTVPLGSAALAYGLGQWLLGG